MRSGLQTFSRENEIAEISRGLKALAKELNIPVIALSQLSRGVESRGGDKKPQLSDLRESGQIEQDADMVLFCYRPEYYGIENYEIGERSFDADGLFMLLINKHRNGELGEIPLQFIKEQAKVTNLNFDKPNFSNTFVQPKEPNEQKPSVLNNMRNELFDEEEKPF
jgi:replicative DNA helicase